MKLRYIAAISGVGIIAGIAGILPWVEEQVAISNAIKNTASLPAVSVSAPPAHTPAQVISGHPVHMRIPSVGIDLPLIDGYYNTKDGSWTLSNTKAQYAVVTPQPNNVSGNTFIYGHATNEVFGKLPNIKAGAEARITLDNGYVFTYRFTDSAVVSPTNTSALNATTTPTLTMQTCTGVWSQYRQMFHFSFQDVAKQ